MSRPPDTASLPEMNVDIRLAPLIRGTIVAIGIGVVMVAICYWYVDRPVATFVHERAFRDWPILRDLTLPPPIVQEWSPLVIVILMAVRACRPFRRWETALLAACVAMILADQFRESLAAVFGRYWPETWTDNNPSWIGNGSYGFHWFHTGRAFESFPSGHTARTVSVAAVAWLAWPRWRWLAVAASLAVAVGLLGMNYHFVGDVIAGGFVGGIVGVWTGRLMGLAK